MKKKILGLMLIIAMLIVIMGILTGCGKNKYENIIVYINNGLSENQITELEESLKSMEGVNSVEYTSKAEALEVAKEKIR